MRILLADDSVTAQNMGKKILAEAGHEVVCVSNGAAALKKVTEQEPDLVILDIYMPGYSGLEVCQRLKEAPATTEIPVVLTVGKLEPFRKEDAQRVRAEALIVKPFEASELAGAVARFAEMLAGKTGKPAKRGKLGPQSKNKPHWEDLPEDDFVTTAQREKMKEEVVGSSAGEPASDREPTVEAQSDVAAAEFEVSAEPEAAAPPAQAAAEAAGDQQQNAEVAAEFDVQEEPAIEPPAIARAAAAGAESSGDASVPEFSVSSPLPATPAIGETIANSPPVSTEMSTAAMPEFSAADSMAVPQVDPAFDPDRTKWATNFATRYGLAEEPDPETEPSQETEAEVSPSQPEAAPAPPSGANDEIAAILSSLPGGLAANTESKPPGESASLGDRPWPAEPAGIAPGDWTAEEVQVEDREGSISLSEEMEKATRMAEVPPAAAVGEQEIADGQIAAAELPPMVGQGQEQAPAAATEADQCNAEGFVGEPRASQDESQPKPAAPAPDRVAGVMQSAAMAIATRATVSAVASQLQARPAEDGDRSTGPRAIEDLVSNVLDRLKPKLIAEIKRELGTPEEK